MAQKFAWFYALQVHDQAQNVRIARADVAGAVRDHDMARLWYSIQMVLGAAAMHSKLLWPANDDKAPEPIRARGSYVRELVKISHDSPLRNKAARNASEDSDERIDDRVLGSATHALADSNAGPLGRLDTAPDDVFRHCDPPADVVIVCGELVELRPLGDEVERILAVPVGYATKKPAVVEGTHADFADALESLATRGCANHRLWLRAVSFDRPSVPGARRHPVPG